MERKSLGKRIWEILGPVVVKEGISFVVMFIVTSIYCMQYMPELMQVANSQEALVEKMFEITEGIYKYIVEISGLAALITIPFLMWMKKRDMRTELTMGIVPNKKAPLSKYFLIAGVSIPLALAANNLLTLSNLAEYSEVYQATADALYSPSLLIQILCLGIIVPISEEYVFRGLIYKRMRRRGNPTGAMISSALFFGLWHGNAVQMVYGIICGLLLAYLYEKYGSLKAPILAHVLMNTVVCLMTDVNAFTWMFSEPIRMAIITIASVAIGSTVFLYVRQIDEKPFVSEEN